jgi:hypothetical protein
MQSITPFFRQLFVMLSLCCSSPLLAQILPGQIVINEFLADNTNSTADQNQEFDDWIELYNTTSSPINLNGLYMTDDFFDPTKWPFPDTTIAANDYLVIWADNDSFQVGLHAFFRLSSNGERLWMGYNNGTVVDSLSFGPQGTDISEGRYPNGTGAFGLMSPTFGASNAPFLVLDSLQAGDLVINEFMADNQNTAADPNGEFDDWIELYNNTSSPISLQYFFLTDDKNDPTKWAFPDTSIGAQAYLIIWADNDTLQLGLHAHFRLGSTGDFLWLGYADGTVIDSLSFGNQLTDVSTGRFPNGTGSFQFMPPTFAAQNASFPPIDTIESGELVLNEIMALNENTQADQNGEFDDWVELYNNTNSPLELKDVFLSDDPNNPAKWNFPDTSIAANDYLIIWADQDSQPGLHANFSLSSSFGESLILAYADGTLIDQLAFGAQIADTSIGRFPNGVGPFGLMLPTFAAANSNIVTIDTIQAGELVINELMADNTFTVTDQDLEYEDWIELYNPGPNPISLSRVFLSDDPAVPNKWPFPDTSIAAQSYLIIWADQDENQSGLHAGFSLANEGENLFLGYSDGTLIDQVSFWPLGADTTFGRFPNGTGSFGYMLPSFAAENLGLLTGIENLSQPLGLRIYPNPAFKELIIQLRDPAEWEMQLCNSLGQEVKRVRFQNQVRLSVGDLPRGIYLLRVGRETHKIILR